MSPQEVLKMAKWKKKDFVKSLLSAVIDNQSYDDHVELLVDKDVSTCTRHQWKGITVKTFQRTFVTWLHLLAWLTF